MKGGYIRFEDDGQFYNLLMNELGTKNNGGLLSQRASSHKSTEPQYSFFGKVTKEVLFGVNEDKNGKKYSWIQFEAHSTQNILDLIKHLLDYIIHKITGKNVGPYGLSTYTEHNPITLKKP